MWGSFMRVLTTEPFPPFLGNQAEIAVITLHKYIDEPLELKGKFQNYASFVGKSEHFQSSHLKKSVVGNKRWAWADSKSAMCMLLKLNFL